MIIIFPWKFALGFSIMMNFNYAVNTKYYLATIFSVFCGSSNWSVCVFIQSW
jgi:hypothetical protein